MRLLVVGGSDAGIAAQAWERAVRGHQVVGASGEPA